MVARDVARPRAMAAPIARAPAAMWPSASRCVTSAIRRPSLSTVRSRCPAEPPWAAVGAAAKRLTAVARTAGRASRVLDMLLLRPPRRISDSGSLEELPGLVHLGLQTLERYAV